MNLPGYEEATKLGYTLCSYGGNRKSADYTKKGVSLQIHERPMGNGLVAKLLFVYGLAIITISDFSFPNKNFKVFEDSIREIKEKLEVVT